MQEPESEIDTAQLRPDWEGAGGNGAGRGGEIPGAGAEGGNYGVAGYGLVLCEARWYGDGQFYQAIRGPRTPMGGYLVTFTGHEEDPPQVSPLPMSVSRQQRGVRIRPRPRKSL